MEDVVRIRLERALANWPNDANVSVRVGDLREVMEAVETAREAYHKGFCDGRDEERRIWHG